MKIHSILRFSHFRIACGSDVEMGQGLEPKRTDIPLYRSQPQLPSHFFIFEQSKRKKLLTWFSTTRRNFEEMKTSKYCIYH